MHRVDWRWLATIVYWVMTLALVLLAFALVYQGGNEARILSGVGLNLNWGESSPEAKGIFGFGFLTSVFVLITLRRVNSLRRQMRDHRP